MLLIEEFQVEVLVKTIHLKGSLRSLKEDVLCQGENSVLEEDEGEEVLDLEVLEEEGDEI